MPIVNGFPHVAQANGYLKNMPASTFFGDVTSFMKLVNGTWKWVPNDLEEVGVALVVTNGFLKIKS
jgi:hypothetical protein